MPVAQAKRVHTEVTPSARAVVSEVDRRAGCQVTAAAQLHPAVRRPCGRLAALGANGAHIRIHTTSATGLLACPTQQCPTGGRASRV
jgi:hypothetical protein